MTEIIPSSFLSAFFYPPSFLSPSLPLAISLSSFFLSSSFSLFSSYLTKDQELLPPTSRTVKGEEKQYIFK
jgi:hypothetical protein